MTAVTATNAPPTANADALCDQMRREHGPYWPCINVPTYTPQPTQNTPPPTAPTPGGPGSGPNAGGSPGPGPGTGNGTPIIPVPGYRAPGLPGQTRPPAQTTGQQRPAPQNPAPQAPAPTPAARVDPGKVTGTIYFNKEETDEVANGDLTALSTCGLLWSKPTGAALCGIAASAIITQAGRAQRRQMCLKIKYTQTWPWTPLPPSAQAAWPDIYSGPDCK
ncbi:hypothetical protein GOARA_068_00700 [Gordonia araii NBRC 100433]|uniref:Uncharacterized protein n=1 Tax=Gordonia araii NBRC 100433 TaxID=1073574 RepID=G7H6D6_9ACTN|nr:hypothetical protein GOARA_068_00700 [Gordonia araii NBRC 100433]